MVNVNVVLACFSKSVVDGNLVIPHMSPLRVEGDLLWISRGVSLCFLGHHQEESLTYSSFPQSAIPEAQFLVDTPWNTAASRGFRAALRYWDRNSELLSATTTSFSEGPDLYNTCCPTCCLTPSFLAQCSSEGVICWDYKCHDIQMCVSLSRMYLRYHKRMGGGTDEERTILSKMDVVVPRKRFCLVSWTSRPNDPWGLAYKQAPWLSAWAPVYHSQAEMQVTTLHLSLCS